MAALAAFLAIPAAGASAASHPSASTLLSRLITNEKSITAQTLDKRATATEGKLASCARTFAADVASGSIPAGPASALQTDVLEDVVLSALAPDIRAENTDLEGLEALAPKVDRSGYAKNLSLAKEELSIDTFCADFSAWQKAGFAARQEPEHTAEAAKFGKLKPPKFNVRWILAKEGERGLKEGDALVGAENHLDTVVSDVADQVGHWYAGLAPAGGTRTGTIGTGVTPPAGAVTVSPEPEPSDNLSASQVSYVEEHLAITL